MHNAHEFYRFISTQGTRDISIKKNYLIDVELKANNFVTHFVERHCVKHNA